MNECPSPPQPSRGSVVRRLSSARVSLAMRATTHVSRSTRTNEETTDAKRPTDSRRGLESRATTKTFFLASIFGLQRRKTCARRSFVSPLPRAVGSHPASPFFVSPAANLENDRAPPRRVPVVGVSTCAPTTRTRLAARFFLFFFFHLGLFPAGVSASSSESPGSRPPSYQHRSLSCDSIFEKSNPPRLHFSGSSILRSRK